MIENIISGVIGGLLVLGCQILYEFFKNRTQQRKNLRVGSLKLPVLAKDFIYTYQPHKFSIDKIVADFGPPMRKFYDSYQDVELEVYKYDFENAIVLFGKESVSSSIISVTLHWVEGSKYPIDCFFSYEDDTTVFGDASINDTILKDISGFENEMFPFGIVCTIHANYFHRPLKYLTFSYRIGGNYDPISNAKGELITAVCVSQVRGVAPFLSVHETMFN